MAGLDLLLDFPTNGSETTLVRVEKSLGLLLLEPLDNGGLTLRR